MLPGGLTTITVTDSYSDITGNPLGGSVTFTASCRLADGNVVFPIQPVTVPVNQATGTFTVTLPCTDNSGLSPAGQWAYRVMIDVQGMDSYPFTVLLPSTLGTSVQLSAVAPSPPFAAPSGMAVYSVNGQTGAVELTASEAGAVPLSGGTMTGPLILSGDPTQALGAATKEYVDNSAGGGTTIDGVTVTGTVASGRTIIATSTSAATWQLPLQVDTTSSDIQPLGSSAVAGNLTQAAAANHVHANTGLVTSGESAGGDLSGTFPASLTVAKIQGTAISSPPGGTTSFLRGDGSWQVPPGSGGATLDSTASDIKTDGTRAAGSSSLAARADHVHQQQVDWISACDPAYGADPTGSADSTTAIQNALNAAPSGGVVYLPAGTFKTTAPLIIPPAITLRGASGNTLSTSPYGTVIKPSSGWTQGAAAAPAVILMLSQSAGSYAGVSEEQKLFDFMISGSSLPSSPSAIHGIQAYGNVGNVTIQHVNVYKVTGVGLYGTVDGSSNGTGAVWEVNRLSVHQAGTNGISLTATDCVWTDCYVIGSGQKANSDGWVIGTSSNSTWVGCRSEDSIGGNGFTYTCGNNTGNGVSFVGCSTQGNYHHGFEITATSSGANAAPVNLSGCRFNGDGTNGGTSGGAYGAVYITAYGSVITINGCIMTVNSLSGGGGPQYGILASSVNANCRVYVSATTIWGYSTALSYDSSGAAFVTDGTCVFVTGLGSSPSYTASPLPLAAGGTGQVTAPAAFNALSPNTTLGDVTYGSGTNTSARLAGNTAATRKFFRQTGTGSVSAAPAWDTLTAGDLPAVSAGNAMVVAASNAPSRMQALADYVCTGTNDHATLNTAIGALPAAGGKILLTPGTYSIAGSVNITASNISIEGCGNATKLNVPSGTNISQVISVSGTGTVEAKLRRFWIAGSITDSSGDGILINTPWSTTDTQHVLEDLYITGCPNNGIKVAASADTRVMLFSRIHVKGCNGNGFYFAYPSCTDSVFTDCIADTVALNGFFIGGANCWFENCKAFYCGSGGTGNYGFYVVGYSNYFSGCQAQDNYYDGFFGDNTGDATYGSFGCTFVNCSGDANGQSAGSSGLRGHGVQQWQVTGGLWMTRPYETSWTQAYGITWEDATAGPSGLRPSSGNSVTGALFRNNATGTIHDTSAGPNYALGNTYASGTPSNSLAGPLAMGSSKITGLANGTASSDAAAFGQLPSSSSPLAITSGGTGQATAAAALTALGGAAALVPLGSPVTASTVTAAAGQFIQCDTTSNAITVTLPASGAADKSLVGVKMITQGSTSGVPYTVTVSCASGDHFNVASTGGTSLTLSVASQGVLLQYDHALAVWYVLADDIPLGQADIRYGATAGTIGAATGTENLTLSTAATWNVTLAGNTTFAFQGPASPSVQSLTVYVTQAASGGPYSVTWPGSVTWFGGTAPAIATSAAGALTVVTLQTINGGTSWYGGIVSNAALPLPVGDGGTGLNALAAYGLVAGGAGTTSPVQQIGTGSLGQVLTSNGSGALPSFQVTSTPPIWEPADSGLVAWNYDPCITNGGSQVLATAGTLYVMAMKVAATTSVTNIYLDLTANGSGLTHGYAGLWQGAGGALLGVTSDQATSWGSGSTNAAPAMAITGGPVTVTAGVVYVGVWFTGTTGPTFYKTAAQNFVNVGLLAASSRWGTANTGLTTTAPSTLGTIAASEYAYWAAVG